MCHSALEVTCMDKESGVWICKLHEQTENNGFIFTETDEPSADKFSWSSSASFVVHLRFDFIPGKKNIFMINMLLLFVVDVVILFLQYVLLVNYMSYVSCTETKGRFLFDSRGIFWSEDSLSVTYSKHRKSIFLVFITFDLKMHTSPVTNTTWLLPLFT